MYGALFAALLSRYTESQTVRLRELRIDRTQTIKLQTPFYCQGLYVYSLWLIVATLLFMLPGFEAINVRL